MSTLHASGLNWSRRCCRGRHRRLLNGSVDFSGEPRLAAGLAVTPMSAQMAKKVLPVFVASKVRSRVVENLTSGDIERIDVAPILRSKICRKTDRRFRRMACLSM